MEAEETRHLSNGASNSDERSAAGEQTISAATVLERVRSVSHQRRTTGSLAPPPQAVQSIEDDEFEVLEGFPWRRAIHATFDLDIRDFLSGDDETFVYRCYRRALLRDPWPHEVRQWTERLSNGWLRTIVVAQLRLSREGRSAGVGVRGLWRRATLALPLMLYRRISASVRRHR